MASPYVEQWLQRRYGPRRARENSRNQPFSQAAAGDDVDALMPDEELEQLVLHGGSPALQAEHSHARDMAARGETPTGPLVDWLSRSAIQRRARRARDRLLLEAREQFDGTHTEAAEQLRRYLWRLGTDELTRPASHRSWSPLHRLVHAAYHQHLVFWPGGKHWPPSRKTLREL